MSLRAFVAIVTVACFAGVAAAQTTPDQTTFGDGRDVDPVVSLGGNHLVFSSEGTRSFGLYLLTFGRTGFTQLTQDEKDDWRPNWVRTTGPSSTARTGESDYHIKAPADQGVCGASGTCGTKALTVVY